MEFLGAGPYKPVSKQSVDCLQAIGRHPCVRLGGEAENVSHSPGVIELPLQVKAHGRAPGRHAVEIVDIAVFDRFANRGAAEQLQDELLVLAGPPPDREPDPTRRDEPSRNEEEPAGESGVSVPER